MIELSPVSQQQRTPVVDILRGWSLLGVVIMNYLSVYGWNTHGKEIASTATSTFIENFTELLFGSKGWPLLAILFGYGFSALLKNISKYNAGKYAFFITRMFWLFAFAFINTLFFGGDILNDYAFIGLLLLAFHKCCSRQLFVIGIAILLLTPLLQSYLGKHKLLFSPKDRDTFYSLYEEGTFVAYLKANLHMRYKWMLRLSYLIIFHLIQLGCFLIGAALERSNAFDTNGFLSNKKVIKKIFWFSFFNSALIYLLQFFIARYEWPFNKYYNLYYPQALVVMLFISISIIWLQSTSKFILIFEAFRATGKMTLTNYILQNIIAFIVLIYSKPGWGITGYFLFGLIVFLLQMPLSQWWLKNYNYGPAEWLWRCLSYKKRFAFKK
ncbi:DUF418 domain-containing protein [Lacibacter luteus]|uniref:DUF418 domain-containing protein n=1 Tax=Lacibacter luteus TaxID=2508719 RepID=A0A4Q1CNM1_9BACT|nr:DUF418 domain-containing protein [Lacibacter luteus]RXK62311.1 DUF418 domain-containing protein [Lacibacter luteus]